MLFQAVICFNAFFNATYTLQLNMRYFIHLFKIQKHPKIDSILLGVPQTIYLFHIGWRMLQILPKRSS